MFKTQFHLLLAGLLLVSLNAQTSARSEGVQITKQEGKLRIEINGQLFSEYHYEGISRPIFYPVIGPGGVGMTRNFPMKEVEGEDRDHPHQRSLWYAHGDVNGHDFWSEGRNAGKTAHQEFLELKSGLEAGIIRTRNKLVARDGTVVATDERVMRIHNRPANERVMDFEITIHASNGEVRMGDTKEGSMAIRVAESMKVRGRGEGTIVNSEGQRDGATWGKRARWCDYHGPVEGKHVGVAIFDHPKNPRHPTWWHVRDYGLFAANPFGIHDFERKPPGAGDLVIPSGESVTFRYRFYFHEGDELQAKVEERYRQYANETDEH
jgi:hypothetical protein